ncbi:hypothetical protein MKW94_030573 [Papaver nudicaule]|uniref:3'-5' exonuclease domain-containing protein n=1 Tax=Papaver nudicaule TaxID=74823 RepID=A0AA41SLL6_PAPNU|nr:hypothetical protein [Papaver nudicaule]
MIITNFFYTGIETTVTSRPEVVSEWITEKWKHYTSMCGRRLVAGLGVRWSPLTNGADTLQICFGTLCLVFQLSQAVSVPVDLELRNFLGDKDMFFILNSRHNLLIGNLINISDHVVIRNPCVYTAYWTPSMNTGIIWNQDVYADYCTPSMKNLAMLFLGFNGVYKDHMVGRSDWSVRDLSIQQIEYAVVDAHVSFEVGRRVLQCLEHFRRASFVCF